MSTSHDETWISFTCTDAELLFSIVHSIIALSDVDLLAAVSSNQDVKMNMLVDDINAYSFLYPVELPDKNLSFKW